MENTKLDQMGSAPILRLLLSITIPVITGMIANALYNIVDRIFVGQFIGKEALAATTLFHPFFMITFAVGSTIAIGSSSLISVSFGRKDNQYAERVLNNAVNLILLIMIITVAVGEIFALPVLKISGTSDNIMPLALKYFYITAPGMLFCNLSFILSCLIRCENHPRFSLRINIIGAVANIILDALFIIIFKWGVFGAGLATTVAQFLSVIYALSFYVKKKSILNLDKIKLIPDFTISARAISIGFSSGLVIFGFGFFSLMMNKTLYIYGGDNAIAIMGIIMGWDSILTLPMCGINDAAQVLYGYNYGAKLFSRIFETIKYAFIGCIGYGLCSTTIVFIAAKYMIMTFSTSPEIIEEGTFAIKIFTSTAALAGIGMLAASLFQALGRAKICIFMGLCRTFISFIPLFMILPRMWGLTGTWLCLPGVDVCGATFGISFLIYEIKKLKKEETILNANRGDASI